tara:strand:- start:28462 stop:28824 length:363 start_codon:yes stop_codon:yes gene_type:complete
MKIEILTTKKKLTKAIIKQLKPATDAQKYIFTTLPVIGYHVRGMGKGFSENLGLFESGSGEWVVVNLYPFEASLDAFKVYAQLPRGWSASKTFDTTGQRNEWLETFSAVKLKCMKNHLII